MKKNISLIGMSGAGKTTTAKELGLLLRSFKVIDTDKLITEKENLTIPKIFEKFGEKYFRNIESLIINDIYTKNNQLISLGGGAFEDKKNRDIIKKNSVVIYLKTSPEKLFARLEGTSDRPLLQNKFSIEKIIEILNKRDDNYQKADIIIETDDKNSYEVALTINEAIKNEF